MRNTLHTLGCNSSIGTKITLIARAGKSEVEGYSTVDHLIEIGCFVKRKKMF